MNHLTDLAALLTDTRLLTRHDHSTRLGIAEHRYHFPAPTQAVLVSAWQQLAEWEKRNLQALAVGRSMNTGVLVGRSAARVTGIPVIALAPDVPEVALPSGGTPSKSCAMPQVRYRKIGLGDDEVMQIHGVRATTPVRTCIDVARFHGFIEGLIAADWLLSDTRTTQADLRWHVERMGRFVGKRTVMQAIEHASTVADSPLESWFRAVLILRGITGWVFQAKVGPYRADFLFDDFLILEIDGRSKYADTPRSALMQERDRERKLINMGYVFRRIHFEDLRHGMDGVLRMVEQARAAQGLRPSG